jgi:hypothetical protein
MYPPVILAPCDTDVSDTLLYNIMVTIISAIYPNVRLDAAIRGGLRLVLIVRHAEREYAV